MTAQGLLSPRSRTRIFDHSLSIERPEQFWTSATGKLEAKENILTQKLQLELVPYPSRSFPGLFKTKKMATENLKWILQDLERLFDAITAEPRTYTLFCSKQFRLIFEALADVDSKNWRAALSVRRPVAGIVKNRLYYSHVRLSYEGKHLSAGIAESFAVQSLPNAYRQMSEYGRFCWENYVHYDSSGDML